MDAKLLINEFVFKAIRSSGPGGQHVNKTSSKIVLSFHIHHSNGLEEYEKERLLKKLAAKISNGMLEFEPVLKKQGVSSHLEIFISKSFTPCSNSNSLLLIKNSFPKGTLV